MAASASAGASTPTRVPWPPLNGSVSLVEVRGSEIHRLLASDIEVKLRTAIAERGSAVLCVSGGKSPIALFEALRDQDLPWQKVSITLADERCVPSKHPDSNALLVQTHLLQGRAARATLIPMVPDAEPPLLKPATLAILAGQALLAAGRADVLVLGMGTDGHTASLFPEAPNLATALDINFPQPCLPIELAEPPANAPYARITQTLAQLLSARHIVLPVSGSEKIATLKLAWAGANPRYPASFVLHQAQTPVAVWLARL